MLFISQLHLDTVPCKKIIKSRYHMILSPDRSVNTTHVDAQPHVTVVFYDYYNR